VAIFFRVARTAMVPGATALHLLDFAVVSTPTAWATAVAICASLAAIGRPTGCTDAILRLKLPKSALGETLSPW
jgi:hypothetical protein